jgi:hypothetical protein
VWLLRAFYGSRVQWCRNWEYLKRREDSSFSDQVISMCFSKASSPSRGDWG